MHRVVVVPLRDVAAELDEVPLHAEHFAVLVKGAAAVVVAGTFGHPQQMGSEDGTIFFVAVDELAAGGTMVRGACTLVRQANLAAAVGGADGQPQCAGAAARNRIRQARRAAKAKHSAQSGR